MNFDLFMALRSGSRAQTPAEKAVLMAFVGYADEHGHAWPSKGALARDTLFGESTVGRAIRALIERGHLELVTVGGGRDRNRYRVMVDAATPSTVTGVPPPQRTPSTVDPLQSGGAPPPQRAGTPSTAGPDDLKKIQRRSLSLVVSDLNTTFERFWLSYPSSRRKGKKDARKAWAKLRPDAALVERIIAALEVLKRSRDWTKDAGQFIPWPQKFINGDRWEDVTAESAPAVGARDLPDVTAWRRDCRHVPPCHSSFEHESKAEAAS